MISPLITSKEKTAMKDFLLALSQNGQRKDFKRGECIYLMGDEPQGIYLVLSGLVGLVHTHTQGHESLLRLFKKEDFFGHRSFFAKEPYHACARCLESTQVVFCSKEVVEMFLAENPSLYPAICQVLAHELGHAELRRVLVSESEVKSRVASALIYFKSLQPEHLWTRAEIASFCATRTPTVISTLAEFEKMGAVSQQGRRIEITDEEILLNMIQD